MNNDAMFLTGVIQEKAEIFSYVSRVDTISYMESILLGDPFNFLSNWPALKVLADVPSCSLCARNVNENFEPVQINQIGQCMRTVWLTK